MKITEIISESNFGTEPKRPARAGSRPARGHKEEPRYKKSGISKDKEDKFHTKLDNLVHDTFGNSPDEVSEGIFDSTPKVDWNKRAKELFAKGLNEQQVAEQLRKEGCPPAQIPVYVQAGQMEEEMVSEKASRQLCKSSTPDEDLGASNLASCKSQGLRARDGEKSHLIGHGNSAVRIKVGGKRIKGKKYGGPLPDYGTRKGQ